ncbi:ParE family toxin-like protein [Aeoliella sp. SH292]|uniref:ParE family toxin-like protein n=1 Tax=Aeoliella sp. SH292 TaxID=3454464 RepID=UPI003F9D59D7
MQQLARKSFELLKQDCKHPSIRFKKLGHFWSARVGRSYRALAIEDESGYVWVWIGHHSEYDRIIK